MAEQSDSTTKAPKSSYKQLDELAQKHRVAVSIFLQVIYLKYYTLTTHLHKSSVLTWKRTEKKSEEKLFNSVLHSVQTVIQKRNILRVLC